MQLSIKELRALADNRGLVNLTFLAGSTPYSKGQRASFEPPAALSYIEYGLAYPTSLLDRLPKPAETKPLPAPGKISDPRDSIEIPEDWAAKKRHVFRIALASKISGIGAKAIGTDENAIEIIRAEIERRAGKLAA